jgi:hypothetical protein
MAEFIAKKLMTSQNCIDLEQWHIKKTDSHNGEDE